MLWPDSQRAAAAAADTQRAGIKSQRSCQGGFNYATPNVWELSRDKQR